MFIFSLLLGKCRVLGRQRGKGERSQCKLAYKNVTNPGGARCESARHSVDKWLQLSGLERDPAPIQDAPETPLISSGSTTTTHTQWPHQCASASTVVILFQGVIRDHVTKSRLWSQHTWAEIRAIPLASSVIFGKLLTSLCLNSVISKWRRTGVSTSWDWCKAESSQNPVRIFYFSATVVKQMILYNLKWSLQMQFLTTEHYQIWAGPGWLSQNASF